jgi:lipoate-protein ligase A
LNTSGSAWAIEHHVGAASTFHALQPDGHRRAAWWLDVDRPALVLGSTQPESVADLHACAHAHVEVVRRRSGGGAVLLVPGQCAWLDVVVPRDDALWDDDIGRSMWWFGQVWADALAASGVRDVEVHRGPVRHTEWSRLVCFDGLGAGEVTVGGRKAVGISQRRTRGWVRMQSSVHLAPPDLLVSLLSPPRPTADELRPPAIVDTPINALQHAVTAALIKR